MTDLLALVRSAVPLGRLTVDTNVDELADAIASGLPLDMVKTLHSMLEAENDLDRFGLFENLFPDATTPGKRFTYWARELYPRHMEHFAAGKIYRERCFMAANQVGKCSTINSLIDTTQGSKSVGELYDSGQAFDVYAWSGTSKVAARASAPFRKGREPCVRIELSDGRWFEAALGHRVLTAEGWLHIADYVQLSRHQGGLPDDPLLSSWGYGRSVHAAGGRHSTRTTQDCQESCRACHCCGDGQPRGGAALALASSPSPADARLHSPALWRWDGQAGERIGSPSGSLFLPSNSGVATHRAGQCAAFAARGVGTSVLSLFGPARTLLLPRPASFPQPRSKSEVALAQMRGPCGMPVDEECCCASKSSPARIPSRLGELQLHDASGLGQTEIELGPRPLPLPLDGHIGAVYFIGCHEVYDFSVEKWQNYLGGGLVHHNTTAGCWEDACHLTGRYRPWWQGRVFRRPIRAWVAGDTNETTRDILQKELLGEVGYRGHRKTVDGSGLIPRECIGEVTWKQGVPNLVDTVEVKHTSGGWSLLGLKSYDQGRRAFQGTKKELIHLDEEPPQDVYGECLIRTATTRGIVVVTFTPLLGISEVVKSFLPKDYVPSEA